MDTKGSHMMVRGPQDDKLMVSSNGHVAGINLVR